MYLVLLKQGDNTYFLNAMLGLPTPPPVLSLACLAQFGMESQAAAQAKD